MLIGLKKVGIDRFLVDKEHYNEYLPYLRGEPGVQLIPGSQKMELHLSHLPLLPGWASSALSDPLPFTNAEVCLPDWWSKELFDTQVEDALWANQRYGSIIAADLGMGKTRTAIAGGNSPYVILCPKSAMTVWEDEAHYAELTTQRLEQPCKTFDEFKAFFEERQQTNVWIVNYHSAHRWLPYFCRLGPAPNVHTLIADEAHYMQKSALKWTKAFQAIERQQVILLTATPIRNRLASLWPLLNIACPTAFGSQYEFRIAYCGATHGPYGLVDMSPSPQALDRLRKRLSVVVKKRVRPANSVVPIHREVIHAKVDRSHVIDIVKETGKASSHRLAWTTKLRSKIGTLKIPTAVELAKKELPKWGRGVFWVWHDDEVAKPLKRALEDVGISVTMLLGRTTQKKRDEIAREWKNGNASVNGPEALIISIGAGSTAISLTSCGLQVFVENDWAPLQMRQAETRCHRFGQQFNRCLVYYITIPGTVDDHIGQILLEKAAESESVLGVDGQSEQIKSMLGVSEKESDEEFLTRVVERLKRKG